MLVLADLKKGTCKALVPSGLEALPDKHAACQALDESGLHKGKRCPGTLVMDTECFLQGLHASTCQGTLACSSLS